MMIPNERIKQLATSDYGAAPAPSHQEARDMARELEAARDIAEDIVQVCCKLGRESGDGEKPTMATFLAKGEAALDECDEQDRPFAKAWLRVAKWADEITRRAEDIIPRKRWSADGHWISLLGVYGCGSGGMLYTVSFEDSDIRSVTGMSEAEINARYPLMIDPAVAVEAAPTSP